MTVFDILLVFLLLSFSYSKNNLNFFITQNFNFLKSKVKMTTNSSFSWDDISLPPTPINGHLSGSNVSLSSFGSSPLPNSSDIIVSVELRRNDSGKTVGVYQERLYNRDDLTNSNIKDFVQSYDRRLLDLFSDQFHPLLPLSKLHYLLYWTRYNDRDPNGFYFKANAGQDLSVLPDPFINPSTEAYLLVLVYYLVEKIDDTISHEGHTPMEWVD